MTISRLALAVLVCAAVGFSRPSAALDWSRPWAPPHGVHAALAESDEFAWRLFVALNWPSRASAGVADQSSRLGASRPVVWETWSTATDLFLTKGADPAPWKFDRPPATRTDSRRFENPAAPGLENVRHVVAGRMVPLTPLNAGRLVEVRMNRIAHEYIRTRGLYSVEGQRQAVLAVKAIRFPRGALELKASWRPIAESEQSRYYTVRLTGEEGVSRLYGLTALNIAAKELPNWFWASFEHLDNASRADGDGWQLPSQDSFACGRERPDCGRAPAGIGLEGTVWANYRLRGTQTEFLDAAGQPRLLGNSELEAGIQRTASCMTCHARSTIAVRPSLPLRLSVFSEVGARSGYVGNPQSSWFDVGSVGQIATPTRRRYAALDFVWSLAQAKSVGEVQ